MKNRGKNLMVVVSGGPDVGWFADVGAGPIYAGRALANDLVLTGPQISREHLLIFMRRGTVWCQDLGSTTGSFYRGRFRTRRIGNRPRRWHRRARIELGGHSLSLVPDWRTPTHARGGFPIETLTRIALPAAMMLVMIPLYARMGGGRILFGLVFGLSAVLMGFGAWRTWRERKEDTGAEEISARHITPAQLLTHSHRSPAPKAKVWETGSALRKLTFIPPLPVGASAAVVGQGNEGFARWLLAQWATFGAHDELSFHTEIPGESWLNQLPHRGARRVVFARSSQAYSPPPAGVSMIVLCDDLAQVPQWCSQVFQVRYPHDRQVSARFGQTIAYQLRARLHTQTLPSLIEFDDLSHEPGDVHTLAAPIGVSEDGPVTIDLVRDGPHALIAGMTGSGKSEFLTTWLLSLCHSYSPAQLGLILIDYKGGATFLPLLPLPHTLGVVTDLGANLTARVLTSLHAELLRREAVLAQLGARSILQAPQLGRLLIVVDEFRSLATEHPEFLESLVRLAAQGRSLGLHLILATQRPGGIVHADVRANLPLRISFRVQTQADSLDILEADDAAHLAAIPGRGILRTQESLVFQSAYVGPKQQAITQQIASKFSHVQPLPRPWAQSVPAQLLSEELDAYVTPAPGLIGVIDRPDQQTYLPWFLPAGQGLLIEGASGHTTVCRQIARAHLELGRSVAVISADSPWPHCYGYAHPGQADQVNQLLHHLMASPPPDLTLIIDDADLYLRATDYIQPGYGLGLLQELLQMRRRQGFSIAIATLSASTRLAPLVDQQFFTGVKDATSLTLAGVPRELVGTYPPGQGVLIAAGGSHVAHAIYPQPLPYPHTELSASPPAWATLPEEVSEEVTGHYHGPGLSIGVGNFLTGDGARAPVVFTPGHTITVAGPRGSGRSHALAVLTAQLTRLGFAIWRDPEDVPLPPPGPGYLVLDDLRGANLRAIHVPDEVPVLAAVLVDELAHPLPGFSTRLAEAEVAIYLGTAPPPSIGGNLTRFFPAVMSPGYALICQGQNLDVARVYSPKS